MSEPRADRIREVRSLFQERGGGAVPTSALQLELAGIDFREARALNKLWHSRLPRIGSGAIDKQPWPSFAASFDGLYYAVAIWSNPVARLLPQHEWLELRRLAVAPDAPRNTASRMLAVMTLLIRRNRPGVVRLISYQDTVVHTGAIYRAAGWRRSTLSDGGDWTRPNQNRHRPKPQSDEPKLCWDKCLVCSMSDLSLCEVCRERFPGDRRVEEE